MSTPPDLRTERLSLRPPSAGDAEAVYEEYAADPEVTRYLMWKPHRSTETVAAFLNALIERQRTGHELAWAITLSGRPVGMITARLQSGTADIGYVLGRRHWSRGYMTEAIAAVADWLLARGDIFRVSAFCDAGNLRSARALEKAGFEREGLLRKWAVHPNLSPRPRDCYVYGRVRP